MYSAVRREKWAWRLGATACCVAGLVAAQLPAVRTQAATPQTSAPAVRSGPAEQRRIKDRPSPAAFTNTPGDFGSTPQASLDDPEPDAPSSGERRAAGPGLFSSGFEPPCFVGYIGGGSSGQPQNCVWHASTSAETDSTQPRITNLTPATGTQHLRLQYDPNQPSNTNARNWAFSDNITPVPLPGIVSVSLKLKISTTGGLNTFSIRPQAPSQITVTTEMQFTPDGMIFAFEDPTPGDGTIDALPTGYTWTPGVYKDVSICVDAVNNRIRYFYDGDMVWSTGVGEGGLGSGVFAGDIIEHVVLRLLHNYGDGVTMDVDDVTIQPNACLEPTGACCNIDGAGTCLRVDQATCEASPSGIFQGLNTDCSAQTCSANDANCQDLSTQDALRSTAGAFQVTDNFRPVATGAITFLSWNGAYLPFVADDDFTITYYPCVNGLPDSAHPLASFSQSAGTLSDVARQNTGLVIDAVEVPIFEYTVDHAPVSTSANQVYFVEIVNAVEAGASWYWSLKSVTDAEGDGQAFQKLEGLPYARYGCVEDLSFCTNLEMAPPGGVCPIPPPTPCELDVSEADTFEGENCGQVPDANPACSVWPPGQYTDIVPSTDPTSPTLIHGESWADSGALPGQDRDVDWYRFTVPEGLDSNGDGEVIACVLTASEMPLKALMVTDDFVDGECGKLAFYTLDAVGFECSASLAIGYVILDQTENLILVRTADCDEIFDGVPCGGDGVSSLGNDYLLEVALTDDFALCFTERPVCPTTCLMDLNRNGVVNAADLALLLGAWGPNPGSCADANESETVDAADLALLLGSWGNCQ